MEFDEFVSKIADEVRAYRGERALVYYFYDNSSRNISALTKEIGRELGLHWYPTKVRNTKQDAKWLNEDDPHIISYRLECPFIQRRVHEMEKIRYRFAINMFIHMHKNILFTSLSVFSYHFSFLTHFSMSLSVTESARMRMLRGTLS